MKKIMKTDIILAGVGGQGIISIANVIGLAALNENCYLKQSEVHGMSQRGGDVQSTLRISDNPIASDLIPKKGADLIISMEPMEALRYLPYLKDTGWIVTNTVPFKNIQNYPEPDKLMEELKKVPNVVAIDIEEIAKAQGAPRSVNMVLLGAASRFIHLDTDSLRNAIKEYFQSKGEKIVNQNLDCFEAGINQ